MMLFRSSLLLLLFIVLGGAQAAELETVAELPAETPPGNIGVGPDGRIFLSVHGFYGQPTKVVELLKDGSTKPYPTKEWATAPAGDGDGLNGVLGLNVDQNGVLWLLDTSSPEHAGRLVAWNTKTETLHRIIYLAPPVITAASFLNDLAIDLTHQAIYIADTGTASIIVVDLTTGRARRVLEGSASTRAEDIDMIIDGAVVKLGGAPARLGVNPITIDAQNEYVYFGAMNGTAVYRVKTSDLRNVDLTSAELAQRVARYGEKPISDGITMDTAGNVYITSITENAVGVVKPDGSYETLFQQDAISWPDGFAVGPDDYIYVTVNQLHRSPALNDGQNKSKGLFKVMRFKALAKAETGR